VGQEGGLEAALAICWDGIHLVSEVTRRKLEPNNIGGSTDGARREVQEGALSTSSQDAELRLLLVTSAHRASVSAKCEPRVCVPHFVHHCAGILPERVQHRAKVRLSECGVRSGGSGGSQVRSRF
jgi:hypothetical protein